MSGRDTIVATAPARFDLRTLAPEHPTFGAHDGHDYIIRLPLELNYWEKAMIQRASQARLDALDRWRQDGLDAEAAREAAAMLREQIRYLIPDLPAAQLDALRDHEALSFIGWWNEHFGVPTSGAAAPGPAPTTTSPTSSGDSAAPTRPTSSATS